MQLKKRLQRHRKHGGARKIGRSKVKCERYRLLKTREKNKVRKIKKHLKRNVNDKHALSRLLELEAFLGL